MQKGMTESRSDLEESRSFCSDVPADCICSQHSQPAVVYCKQCDKPLCGDCLSEHKAHNYLTIQEIEAEIIPLMKKRNEKGESYLKNLEERRDRLLVRIQKIREGQDEREKSIKLYMKTIESMIYKKHQEMINDEEEMVEKLIPLTFRVEKQIANAKKEIMDSQSKLSELQAMRQPDRTWKAFKIISEKKSQYNNYYIIFIVDIFVYLILFCCIN